MTIRETDGEDEGELTRLSSTGDNSSLVSFVTKIITDCDGKGPLTVEQVKKLPWRTVNYSLLKSRIHSLGEKVEFLHICGNPSCRRHIDKLEIPFEEDLSLFDFDYSNGEPSESNSLAAKSYPKEAITKNPENYFFRTKSGNNYSARWKNFDVDNKNSTIDQSTADINHYLLVRDLCIQQRDGSFQPLKNFRGIPSREMADIRSLMMKTDPEWQPVSEVKCPSCGSVANLPILNQPAFFFPGITL
jgi:hypothetical protein